MTEEVAIGLGLGGNLGHPATTIARACEMLPARGGVRLVAASSLYRTAPWGPVAQPDFINCCALARTSLSPRELLAEVKTVETLLGRRVGERWGPRAIDIDILFYGDGIVDVPDLVIPHRSLFERAFVLVPLAEIAPGLVIADRGVAPAAMLIDRSGIHLHGPPPWRDPG